MKKKEFLMGMFGILLIFGVLFVGCDNGSTDEEEEEVEETFTSLASVITLSGVITDTDKPVNPAGLVLSEAKQSDSTGIIYITLTGTAGTTITNPTVEGELIGAIPVKDSAKSAGYSGVVIAGLLDPDDGLFDSDEPATIRQYNQALHIGTSYNENTYDHENNNPDVYREKDYDGGTNSYYLDTLGGFEILLWGGASRKTITLIITPDDEDVPAKTIVIDYSAVLFE
jgi:hypothetical protein